MAYRLIDYLDMRERNRLAELAKKVGVTLKTKDSLIINSDGSDAIYPCLMLDMPQLNRMIRHYRKKYESTKDIIYKHIVKDLDKIKKRLIKG